LDIKTYDLSNYVMAYLDVIPTIIMVVDDDVRILTFNRTSTEVLRLDAASAITTRAGEVLHCLHSTDSPEGCGRGPTCKDCIIRNSVNDAMQNHATKRKYHPLSIVSGENIRHIECLVTTSPISFNGMTCAILVLEDISEIAELRKLIPICAWCRKIRDDSNYWQSVEQYLSRKMHFDLTHGICPDCAIQLKQEIETKNRSV